MRSILLSGLTYMFWFCPNLSHAQNLPLQNLKEDSMRKIVGDFSANFLHTSVSGASTLGRLFGFEVGLVGGRTNTPHINEVVKENSSSSEDASKFPHAALLGVVTVPLGFTAEVGLIPKVGSDEFKFQTLSLAGKWTANEIFSVLPLSLAAKLSFTHTALDFKETINTVPTNFTYKNRQTALTFLASKDFAIVEPYVGLGVVSAQGDLTATGSTTVFLTSYTASDSASIKRSSSLFLLGTEVKLLIFKFGLEYTRVFDTSRFSGKLSLYF